MEAIEKFDNYADVTDFVKTRSRSAVGNYAQAMRVKAREDPTCPNAKSLISLLNKGHDVFSKEENDKFFEGIQKFDNWEDIANHVGTRSIYSIRRKAKGLIKEKNKFPTPSFDKTKLEKLY